MEIKAAVIPASTPPIPPGVGVIAIANTLNVKIKKVCSKDTCTLSESMIINRANV